MDGFNLGFRELATIATVGSGLAVTWGMVRQQLNAPRQDRRPNRSSCRQARDACGN